MATDTAWMTATAVVNGTIRTARYKNYTLVSPTVYIEFKTAYATNTCGQTVGGTYPGALLAVDPKSLHSIKASDDWYTSDIGPSSTTTFYPSGTFDFRNLNGLAPASVYYDQPSCFAWGCGTVFDDYHPVLVLPTQIRNMDPAWRTCALDFRGAWDPPIALQPAEQMAGVTTLADPTHTIPPSPQSAITGPASQTAGPAGDTEPQNDPTQTARADPASTVAPPNGSSEDPSDQSQPSPTPPDLSANDLTDDPNEPTTASAKDGAFSVTFSTKSPTPALPTSPSQEVTTTIYALPQPAGTAQAEPSAQSAKSQNEQLAADSQTIVEGGTALAETTVIVETQPSDENAPAATQDAQTHPPDAGDPPKSVTSVEAESPAKPPVVAGHTVSVEPSGGLAIAGTTLIPGSDPLTISSVAYSAISDGGLVVVSNSPDLDSSTHVDPTNAYEVLTAAQNSPSPLSTAATTSQVAVVTGQDGTLHTIVPVGGGFEVDGHTTVRAGQAATVPGLGAVSAGTDGDIVGGGPTAPSSASGALQATTISGAVLELGEETYTAYLARDTSRPDLVMEGEATTLTAAQGTFATISAGQTLSLNEAGNLVLADSTVHFSQLSSSNIPPALIQPTQTEQQTEAVLTLGSTTLTAIPFTAKGTGTGTATDLVVLDSQTLTIGGSALTTADHTLSAATNGILDNNSLVAFTTRTSTVTGTRTLPSFESDDGSATRSLPVVLAGTPTGAGAGAESSGAAAETGDAGAVADAESTAIKLRDIPHFLEWWTLAWLVAVFVLL